MSYHRYGEVTSEGFPEGVTNPAETPAETPETAAPQRFWTPGLMIAAIALLAAWWLRKH